MPTLAAFCLEQFHRLHDRSMLLSSQFVNATSGLGINVCLTLESQNSLCLGIEEQMEGYILRAVHRERAMKYWVLFLLCLLAPTVWSQTLQQTAQGVVISAQIQAHGVETGGH